MKSSLLRSADGLRITTPRMNELMQKFTLSNRPWTAFSADKVEIVARYYNAVPYNWCYADFDSDCEELIFREPLGMSILVPLTLWQHVRMWWRERKWRRE